MTSRHLVTLALMPTYLRDTTLDAWKTRLDFELKLIEAKAQRELAIAELSLLVAGNQPSGSPLAGFPNN